MESSDHGMTRRLLAVYGAAFAGVLGLMAYYAFTIGTDRNDWQAVARAARAWGGSWGSLPVLFGCYYAGSLLSLPGLVMLTVLVTCLGPLSGLAVVVTGTAASSATVHALARRMGRGIVHELYPWELEQVERLIQGPPLLRVLQMRLLPVLPFHLVNAVCGLVGIPFRAFLAGTILGLFPKMLVQLYFVRTLLKGLTAPGTVVLTNAVVSLILFALVTLAGIRIERHIRAVRPPEPPPPPPVTAPP